MRTAARGGAAGSAGARRERLAQAAAARWGGHAAGSSGRRGASDARDAAGSVKRAARRRAAVGRRAAGRPPAATGSGVEFEEEARKRHFRRVGCGAGAGDAAGAGGELELKQAASGPSGGDAGPAPVAGAAGAEPPGAPERPPAAGLGGERGAAPAPAPAPAKKTTVKFKIVRVFSGLVAGGIGAFVTFTGGLVFSAFVCVMAAQITREYSRMISSLGPKPSGDVTPVPMAVTNVLPLLNVGMVLTEVLRWTPLDCSFIVSSFIVLTLLLTQREAPALLEHAAFGVFGIFYCGFLPTFWLKLRNLAALAPPSALTDAWPVRWARAPPRGVCPAPPAPPATEHRSRAAAGCPRRVRARLRRPRGHRLHGLLHRRGGRRGVLRGEEHGAHAADARQPEEDRGGRRVRPARELGDGVRPALPPQVAEPQRRL